MNDDVIITEPHLRLTSNKQLLCIYHLCISVLYSYYMFNRDIGNPVLFSLNLLNS